MYAQMSQIFLNMIERKYFFIIFHKKKEIKNLWLIIIVEE